MSTAYLFEFIGTALMIVVGNGSVANILLKETKGYAGGTLMCVIAWACGVMMAVAVSSDYSGAHLNPAVTLGLAIAGKLQWDLLMAYVLAQFLGAMFGSVLVYLYFRNHYSISTNATEILATFSTVPAIRKLRNNFFSEFLCGFVLLLVILFSSAPVLSIQGESVSMGLGALGALPTGILIIGIGLSLGGTTGFAMNPARDLGPRIMHALLPIPHKGTSDWGYAWVPSVAPLLGGAGAALLYLLIK